MGLIPKKLSRTGKAGMLAISSGMASFTMLLTAAVLSRVLTKTDYASYRQTLLTFAMISPILGLGLGQALYYFIPREPSKSRSLLTGNLIVLFGAGLLFAAAILLGGNKLLAKGFNNPSLGTLLLIFSPYALFALPMASLGPCLMSLDRVKLLTVYNVLRPAVILALVCGAALFWQTPAAAVGGMVAGSFLLFIAAIPLMYKACGDGSWRPKLKDILRQVNFGVALAVAGVLGSLFMKVDKVVVSSMCSPSQFAVYVNGATEVPLIGIITASATAVLLPEFSRLFREGNTQAVLDLWHRAIVKAAHILIPLSCLLFVLAPEIMTFLFSSRYRGSASVFRIYLLEVPLRVTVYGAVLIAAGKQRVLLYRSVGALVLNIPLSILLVSFLGPIGAALATVLIICGWAVPFSLRHIRRCSGGGWRSLMPWAPLFRISALYVGAAGLVLALRLLHLPVLLFVLAAILLFAPCVFYTLNRGGVLHPLQFVRSLRTAGN